MDDQRVGAAFRAVRIRRSWTQANVASAAGVSASLVSLIERGHLNSVSLRVLRSVGAALDIRVDVKPWLRAGDIDRLLNAGHAALHEDLARMLGTLPDWVHAPEVSFAIYRERGVIDILCFHAKTGTLLIIELKTELISFEDLLTTMDVRVRLGRLIAAERGWMAKSVSCWVVVAATSPNRRRIRDHSGLIRSAFPANGNDVRVWLRNPHGSIRALSMWSISNGRGAKRPVALIRRVRHATAGSKVA